MNNLHRELAPISDAAWDSIDTEARRTFSLHVAGRRIADVSGPGGLTLAAVGTGRLGDLEPPADGVTARMRQSQPLIELRVPFTVARQEIDAVERGASDSDWSAVKEAAKRIAFAEDRAVFQGYAAGNIAGIGPSSTNAPLGLPAAVRDYPDTVSQALTALRLAGVDGPYSLLLGAEAYTAVYETSDHGYPIAEHLGRLLDGEIIWAPAIDGAFLMSARGGDYDLRLGQDLSIGYQSHDAASVELYFVESLTFLNYTAEAAVVLTPAAAVR
jgi:uncharacterized linocin/CFP29 family protein